MTPEAVDQIRASYAQATATPRQLAARFYHELFTAAPNLRRLFPGDLTLLQGHFESAIALVVRNLEEMSALRESLRDLGAQHVHWGARPEDYVSAREALVAALAALIPSWSDTLEQNWRTAVTGIIVPMLEGAAIHTAMMAEHLAGDAPDLP
jgi:hemoglobin-like flavoprotein